MRRQLVAAALVGWILVIIVAAGRRPQERPLVGVDGLDVVLLVGILIFALFGLILLIILNPFQSEWKEPDRRKANGYLILLIVAFALLYLRPDLLQNILDQREEQAEGIEADAGLQDFVPQEPTETVAQAVDILALVAIVGAVAVVVILLRRRTTEAPPDLDEEFEADLLDAVDEAEMQLAEDQDPRSAVLHAYRTLEVVLASRTSRRSESETTAEHITRSLSTLPVNPEAIIQLADLYEIARFSDQEISWQQRSDARAALGKARQELRTSR